MATSDKKESSKKEPAKKSGSGKAAAKATAKTRGEAESSEAKTDAKKTAAKKPEKKWSKEVTEHSDAMTLEQDIFKSDDPKKIAASVKKSAEKSDRRKSTPFQSAMSMITFYENRGGSNITAAHKKVLDDAKDELRKLFGKDVD
jgi:hypothetical protein